jgi:phosphoribosylformimino-5-aminoimidazole carboxamide ribotide isomerase
MLIIPAIDLKDGRVVRLTRGRYDLKVYSRDPLKIARRWQRQGARLIHVVDLDGAIYGCFRNLDWVVRIIKEVKIPVQFGGGLRKKDDIQALLDIGAERVVLGTKAVEDEKFLESMIRKFKNRIIVSIDESKSYVLTKGWRKSHDIKALDFAKRLQDKGLKQIVYTDITRDGSLKGPNINGLRGILKQTHLSVIASGGISSLQDIERLNRLTKYGLQAVIVGKALYERRFTLKEALKIC